MTVMSVTGPLRGDQLGATLVHEHIVVSMPGEELDPHYAPDRPEIVAMAVDRLQELKSHGVATIVDPCPIELGRDPELYLEVSQKSGVNIVFATGFYMEELGIPMYWRARDANEIAEFYLKELTDGVGRTGFRPGVIKAATGVEVTPAERRVLTAAGMAQKQAGVAIITHTEHSKHGDTQQQIFAEAGADMSRVLIGHQDEQTSPEPMLKLAKRGTFVGVDRIGMEMLAPDDTRADNVTALVKHGHGKQVCLSQDCVCAMTAPRFPFRLPDNIPMEHRPSPKTWPKMTKPMSYVLTDFVPRLLKRGVSQTDIDTIFRDNPRRLLTGES
jgi:phosphotriesterase-related protein